MEQFWADQEMKKDEDIQKQENENAEKDQDSNMEKEDDKKPTVISKITKDSEFAYVCNQLREQTGKAEKWEIDQLK